MSDNPPPKSEWAAWNVMSYLLTGLLVYGTLGWVVDRWLGTKLFTLLGMLLGVAAGGYLIYIRYVKPRS